jgi:hypothetical protein
MSGIETVGGCCPNCSKVLHQKWESGGMGFMFDACYFCGFFQDNEQKSIEDNISTAIEVFVVNIARHNVSSIEDMQGIYKTYTGDPEKDDFYPTLFDYSKLDRTQIKDATLDFSTVNWKELIATEKARQSEGNETKLNQNETNKGWIESEQSRFF